MGDASAVARSDRKRGSRTFSDLRDAGIAAGIGVLAVLLLDPINGALPGINIDLSWPYTLADATSRHIPFGRDLVFTMGPLASLYTRFFLPDQRVTIFVVKAILLMALCFATVAMTRRSIRWLALAFPLLLANIILTDAVFFVMVWVIVPLATSSWKSRRWQMAALLAYSACLGPLLLVKGSLAVPLLVSIGGAALARLQRSWIEALALPIVAILAIITAWLATGQQLADLPFYLRGVSFVAKGYTNAMSMTGDPKEIWAFLAGAALLLGSQFLPRRGSVLPVLTAAVILWVAFKAGFVRHDLHATIAGGTLALLGYMLFLVRGNLATGFAMIASIGIGLGINSDSHFWSIDPASSWDRLTSTATANFDALRAAAIDPGAFDRAFHAGKAVIAAEAALPPTTGTVDLYPDDQEFLLASNRAYYPRPVMQSYSAYTPELAFLNAAHLEGPHAPETVFFGIAPIDEHHPAMEDGPSWPALLGQYRFRTYSGPYAVLDRVAGSSAGAIDAPVLSGTPRFGDSVSVPDSMPFVWVTMQFHPTLLGRAMSALFKMPLLHMDVTTADGQTATFRVVPGMASAGFLLSPTVTSARNFVALRSTSTDALASQRVTAINLHEDGGFGLWGRDFAIQFAALHIPTDPDVDDAALGHLDAGPSAAVLPASGECVIDAVGNVLVTPETMVVQGKTATVTGWGYTSPGEQGEDGGDLRIAVTPAQGSTVYAKADRMARPDVDAHFKLSKPTRAGFTAQVNLSEIKGPATLRVVQDTPAGTAVCGQAVDIDRTPTATPRG